MLHLSHSRVLRFIALIAVVVLAFSLGGCAKKSRDAKLRLDGSGGSKVAQAGNEGSGSATGSIDATGGTKSPDASSQEPGSGSGSGATGGSGSGSSGGSASGGATTAGMRVRILYWNDTSSKKAQGAEVVYGTSAYRPNIAGESDTGIIGPCPYDKVLTLVIYPDGRNGKKIEVPFKVAGHMRPASEQDAIHVSISDDKVRVLGNPIDNFDQTFSRF